MPMSEFKRPLTPGDRFFDQIDAGIDPEKVQEAAERSAAALIRGSAGRDPELASAMARRAAQKVDVLWNRYRLKQLPAQASR